MQTYPMTPEGYNALENEVNFLKKERRPAITAKIAEARELGDLKENAEYHAAREEQGLVEARIRDIEAKLQFAQVIDVKNFADSGKVVFGSTVKLLNLNDEKEVSYRIVGEEEANLKEGKISAISPIAKAMLNKQEGDEFVLQAPSGQIEYEIIEISY